MRNTLLVLFYQYTSNIACVAKLVLMIFLSKNKIEFDTIMLLAAKRVEIRCVQNRCVHNGIESGLT